jgi:hypothetical protein
MCIGVYNVCVCVCVLLQLQLLGQTERIKDNSDPVFTQTIQVPMLPGQVTHVSQAVLMSYIGRPCSKQRLMLYVATL